MEKKLVDLCYATYNPIYQHFHSKKIYILISFSTKYLNLVILDKEEKEGDGLELEGSLISLECRAFSVFTYFYIKNFL